MGSANWVRDPGLERDNTYGRNFHGELDDLFDSLVTLLNRARHVDIAKLLAEVGRGGEELDESVLDCDRDVGAVLDGLLDSAGGLDEELLATKSTYVSI